MKRLGVFLLPPGWDASPSWGYPPALNFFVSSRRRHTRGPRDWSSDVCSSDLGGRAVKPGDILRSASGKTVEVLNTDAEGRLVLGDGLWSAHQLGAPHLVDVAT